MKTFKRMWCVVGISLLMGCIFAAAGVAAETPVHGQEQEIENREGGEPQGKLQWFGFLNVGYGKANGHKHRGIPEGGTADLHTLALQLRYLPTLKDQFVIQIANERVGTSPSNSLRDDLELDWLYYMRELGTETSLKVGRVPLPVGIYNQVKDVGTLLPFYRPSGVFYGDGTWTSDSVDGAVLSHRFKGRSEWALEADVYYGEWDRIESDGLGGYDVADIRKAFGTWLWLETPLPGLRIGAGANRFEASGGVFLAPGVTDTENTTYFSVDGDFDRFRIRAEISDRRFTGGHWRPYYVELDFGLTEKLRATALYDAADLYFEIPFFATFDGKIEEIYGLGLRYFFSSDLVLKLEHQWFEGYGQIEDVALSIFFDQPVRTKTFILSAAFAF